MCEYLTEEIMNGRYVVSADGSVYSNISGKYLKPIDNGSGYKMVCLCINGKVQRKYVHRLVAELFIPNPFGLPEINHKDENRSNNNAANLEWCTSKYNINYGNRAKKFGITRGKPVICVETGIIYFSGGEAQRQTGVRSNEIWACCAGYRNAKTAGGFHWAYVSK